MKTRNLILAAFGLVSLSLAATPIRLAHAQKTTSKFVAWEYKVIVLKDYVEGKDDKVESWQIQLSELGRDGWELVQRDGVVCYLKRSKP